MFSGWEGMHMPLASDTTRDADEVQLRLLRAASPVRRCQLAFALSDTTRHLARRGIDRRYPNLSERERDLVFLRVHYGTEIADSVKETLAGR